MQSTLRKHIRDFSTRLYVAQLLSTTTCVKRTRSSGCKCRVACAVMCMRVIKKMWHLNKCSILGSICWRNKSCPSCGLDSFVGQIHSTAKFGDDD